MGNSWATTGTVKKASTGTTLKIEIANRNGFETVNIQDVLDVIKGKKKHATLYRLKPYPYRPRYR